MSGRFLRLALVCSALLSVSCQSLPAVLVFGKHLGLELNDELTRTDVERTREANQSKEVRQRVAVLVRAHIGIADLAGIAKRLLSKTQFEPTLLDLLAEFCGSF